jgi:hypothetical protein
LPLLAVYVLPKTIPPLVMSQRSNMVGSRLSLRANVIVGVAVAAVAVSACDDKKEAPVAPPVAASAIAPPVVPTGPKTLRFNLDPGGKTSIDMPAPKERIRAQTTAVKGEVTVDPTDLEKTRGQVKVDLLTLSTHTFDDAKKDGAQTEHAHNWLEAGDLVTPAVREANRWVIFTIRGVDGIATRDLAQVAVTHLAAEDARTVDATVKGDFFLHGHSVTKDVPVEVVFHYLTGQATAAPTRIEIRTKAPLHITLADHDVKPRDGLGKLAQASFSLLGTKVAETADVTVDLSGTPAP